MHYYFDVDGVLLDFFSGYASFCQSNGYTLTTDEPQSYCMTGVFANLEQPTLLIDEFQSSEAFSQLLPYRDALIGLEMLRKRGDIVSFITSCGDDKQTKSLRTRNLDQYFSGLFDEVYFLPAKASKHALLSKLQTGVFIDDSSEQITNALLHTQHTCFLRDRKYNREVNLPRLNSLTHLSFSEVDDLLDVPKTVFHSLPNGSHKNQLGHNLF